MIEITCKTEEELEEIKKRFSDCKLHIKDQREWYRTYFVQVELISASCKQVKNGDKTSDKR